MQEYFLYRHIRLDTNKPFYIGIGTKPKKFSSHFSEYKRAYAKKSRNSHWKNIVGKVGYKVEIIMESDNKDLVIENEKYFITLYGRKDLGTGILVNMTAGGEGTDSAIVSEETRKKRSQAMMGENNPMYGKTGEKSTFYGKSHSEETRKRLSELNKGKTHSEETRKKMSDSTKGKNNPMYGKIGSEHPKFGKRPSEETLKKMSETSKKRSGKDSPNSIPVIAIHKVTNEKISFYSIIEAGRYLKIDNSNISKVLRNKLKFTKGYTFEYINN